MDLFVVVVQKGHARNLALRIRMTFMRDLGFRVPGLGFGAKGDILTDMKHRAKRPMMRLSPCGYFSKQFEYKDTHAPLIIPI